MENFLIKPKFYILHSTLYIHKSPAKGDPSAAAPPLRYTKTVGFCVPNVKCKM